MYKFPSRGSVNDQNRNDNNGSRLNHLRMEGEEDEGAIPLASALSATRLLNG